MIIRRHTTILMLAGLLLVAGCGTGEPLAELATGTEDNTVGNIGGTQGEAGEEFGGNDGEFDATLDISDQTTDGEAVTVAQASIEPASGWVVIYTDEADSPAEVIGKAAVESNLTDITVPLDQTLDAGEHKLWAQMHVNADPAGSFQFPGEDIPVTREDGDVVQASFTLTVED